MGPIDGEVNRRQDNLKKWKVISSTYSDNIHWLLISQNCFVT
jgi:hypothetical protein